MTNTVKKEIEKEIEKLGYDCSIEEFKDKVIWYSVSISQKLSLEFIREFKDEVDWSCISIYQKLSLEFIREFKDKVNWSCISEYQELSKKFIREFKDEVFWPSISEYQKLSLEFIREFKDKVSWSYISKSQKLSEEFIREFKDKINWTYISYSQKLSLEFIREFKDEVNKKLYNKVNRKISYSQKLKEVKSYCKKYNLEFDYKNKCFYAFREHDEFGRGMFNRTISYKRNSYYKDWHLDMREEIESSFGLGILPKGNTKVKVLVEDWGVNLSREDDKCRVWGFEVV